MRRLAGGAGVGRPVSRSLLARIVPDRAGCAEPHAPLENSSGLELDRRAWVGFDRHPKLHRRRISNHRLLEVERANSCVPLRNLHLLVAIGALGLLLLVEDEYKTLHSNLHLSTARPSLDISTSTLMAVAV